MFQTKCFKFRFWKIGICLGFRISIFGFYLSLSYHTYAKKLIEGALEEYPQEIWKADCWFFDQNKAGGGHKLNIFFLLPG